VKVSVGSANSNDCGIAELGDVFARIKSDEFRQVIQKIRSLVGSGDSEGAKQAKKNLLAGFIPAGTFSSRKASALLQRSGLVHLDLDDLGTRLPEVRNAIVKDQHTYCVFTSPSGNGLKVFFLCNQNVSHEIAFKTAEAYARQAFEVEPDEQCKDVARLCFFSWDPELYLNEQATLLAHANDDSASAKQVGVSVAKDAAPAVAVSEDEIRALLKAIPPRPEYDKWLRIASSVWSVLPMDAGCRVLNEWSPEEKHNEYEAKWEHRLTEIGIGTLHHYASECVERRAPKEGVGTTPSVDKNPAVSASNPKPIIILPGQHISILEAADNLYPLIAGEREIFYRGGRVQEVVRTKDGSHRLEIVSPTQFRSRLEHYGKLFAWRTGAKGAPVLKPTVCPEETAKALLECVKARDHLPHITKLCSCPVFASLPEGGKVLGPGWHGSHGGLYVAGGDIPPSVPWPAAVRSLKDLLVDFDFPSPGDRSRAIASFITPALHFGGWLRGFVPADVGEADASQSGKTYRQKIIAAVYREIPNIVVQRTGGVGGLDESISQKLVDGRPFILFDNLRGKLDSPYLEMVLTAPGVVPARIPHRGEIQVDPRGFLFQLTSNGVETTRDLGNRSCIVRIRKRPSGYRFTRFNEGDLHDHVVANQTYLLGCVFSIVEHWTSLGQPRTEETRHNFRDWAQVLDWIVQKVFNGAPLLEGHDESLERVSSPVKIWLRSLCIALRDANRLQDSMSASQLADFALENCILPPNVRSDADEGAVSKRIGATMAPVFKTNDTAVVDGFTVTRTKHYSKSSEKNLYFYEFAAPNAA